MRHRRHRHAIAGANRLADIGQRRTIAVWVLSVRWGKGRLMKLSDVAAGAVLCVLGLYTLFVVLPAQTSATGGIGLAPRDLPALATIVVIGLSALLVVRALFAGLRESGSLWPTGWHETSTMLVGFGLTLAGVVAFQYVGFIVGGSLLVVSVMLFMGERSWLRLILTPTVAVGGMYLFVTRLLHLSVP
jgi:tripartite tricarboxylate transporter TctB family protein